MINGFNKATFKGKQETLINRTSFWFRNDLKFLSESYRAQQTFPKRQDVFFLPLYNAQAKKVQVIVIQKNKLKSLKRLRKIPQFIFCNPFLNSRSGKTINLETKCFSSLKKLSVVIWVYDQNEQSVMHRGFTHVLALNNKRISLGSSYVSVSSSQSHKSFLIVVSEKTVRNSHTFTEGATLLAPSVSV